MGKTRRGDHKGKGHGRGKGYAPGRYDESMPLPDFAIPKVSPVFNPVESNWRPGRPYMSEGVAAPVTRPFVPNEFAGKIKVHAMDGTFDATTNKQVFIDLMPATGDKGRALKIKDKTGDRSAFVLIPDQGAAIVEFFGIMLELMRYMGVTVEQARNAVKDIPLYGSLVRNVTPR